MKFLVASPQRKYLTSYQQEYINAYAWVIEAVNDNKYNTLSQIQLINYKEKMFFMRFGK